MVLRCVGWEVTASQLDLPSLMPFSVAGKKSISQMGKMCSGRLWIWKRPMIDQSARYVADAKSVWSWRKIVESSAEFLYRL